MEGHEDGVVLASVHRLHHRHQQWLQHLYMAQLSKTTLYSLGSILS